uniref:Uncharacterized protein n=1 Tax=viral metagenome TaxID=1070528 RepID=A0A6M3KD28_9ZZZZ
MATIQEVKVFFGYGNLASFRADWNKLSADEKAWFRKEVKTVI